jgi:hypothetical protein
MIIFSQPIEQFPPSLAFATTPTLSAGTDVAYPPSRLLTYSLSEVTRCNASSTNINWDFGRARKFNVVSLFGCNVGMRGTWTVYGSQNGSDFTVLMPTSAFWAQLPAVQASLPAAGSDEDLDPRTDAREKSVAYFYSEADFSYRYLRIQVTDPDATAMTFGRLFVGRTFRPKISYQYGSSLVFGDTGTFDRTDNGASVMNPGRSIPGAQVKMNFLSTQEVYDYVYDFAYWRGSCREILCCLDVNTRSRLNKNLLYCRISEGRQVTADDFEAWSQTWILESI